MIRWLILKTAIKINKNVFHSVFFNLKTTIRPFSLEKFIEWDNSKESSKKTKNRNNEIFRSNCIIIIFIIFILFKYYF